jgi:hypothetical protein
MIKIRRDPFSLKTFATGNLTDFSSFFLNRFRVSIKKILQKYTLQNISKLSKQYEKKILFAHHGEYFAVETNNGLYRSI